MMTPAEAWYSGLRFEVQKRLESITHHSISLRMIFSKNGKKLTCEYYDCTTEKWMKCTVAHGCLISNIRDFKEMNKT